MLAMTMPAAVFQDIFLLVEFKIGSGIDFRIYTLKFE
jgi:hypothetical protein